MADEVRYVVMDSHGPMYRYSDKPGITLVDMITQKDAADADPIFVAAMKKFNRKCGGIYTPGILAVSEDPELKAVGSKPLYWEIDDVMTRAILARKDDSCGIELNMSAARFILDELNGNNMGAHRGYIGGILIASSARVSESAAVLETLMRLYLRDANGRNTAQEMGDWVYEVGNSPDTFGIAMCDMTQYGSKREPESWRKAIQNHILAQNSDRDVFIKMVIEDKPENCDAAAEGIVLANLRQGSVKQFHQIGPNGPEAVSQ